MSLIKTFKTRHDQSQRGPRALPSQPIQDSAASFLVTASMATVHWPALQGNRISGKTETFNNSTCQYRSERNGCTCTNLLNKPTNRMSDPSEWPEQCSVCPPGKPHITSLVSKSPRKSAPLTPVCQTLHCVWISSFNISLPFLVAHSSD